MKIVNDSIILIAIASHGTNTAGENYSLECLAVNNPSNITWLLPPTSAMVTTTGSMSTLTLSPLAASHAGTYTCSTMVEGSVQTATLSITVQSEYNK